MLRYRQTLPNPSHLLTFEAAGRHLSFTLAASELNVTRVAVSQQMKTLETHLGVKLFHRLPRSLSLTVAGEQYRIAVSEAFRSLEVATKEIKSDRSADSVTITSTAAIATHWLMPRIGQFRKHNPEIDIRILVAERYLDLAAENIDVAIRYGERKWPGTNSEALFPDRIIPVCAPEYLKGREALCDPADLLDEHLIHLEGLYHGGHMWSHWFTEQGVKETKIPGSMHVNSYSNLVQVTLDGQGISLLGAPLIQSYLDSGQLVTACTAPDIPHIKRQTYYIVTRKHKELSNPAQLICNMLRTFAET